jgi:hypothetical protein
MVFHVEVFEAARELKPWVLVLICCRMQARVLTALGLEEGIRSIAVATSELAYYNKFGQKIWQEPRGKYAGYKWSHTPFIAGYFSCF